MKYTRKIRLVLLLLTIAFATFGAMTASAGVNFNSTNYIALKRNKKKSAKLKGLTKKQKKKKWTFKSSDTSIVKVKRSGKYGYKLTANKKKDGYAVIRATQSKTAIYLLVKVGKGSTSTNGNTKAWASYGRSAFRQGTSAYNTWNKVVNPNSGGNSGNTTSGSSGSTGSGSTETTDWYATHPQYTNVLAVYGARDNKMVPTPATSVVGKDQNGYGYDTNGIIGTDRNGKKIKGIIPPITFTIETIPWFDQYLKSFDNGYYTGNGGPNYIGKNVLFTDCGLSFGTEGFVKIKTSAPIDDATTKALHGVKITQGFIDGKWKGQMAGLNARYTDLTPALGGQPSGCSGLTSSKLNGCYYAMIGSSGAYGTYRYSVTIDGVTKHVDFNIVDHVTEFKNWYIHKYDSVPQAEVSRYMQHHVYPDAVEEAAARIEIVNSIDNVGNGTHQLQALVYKNASSILRGIPSFIATDVFPGGTGTIGTPGCSLALAYSNYASDAIKEHHDISPGYWGTYSYDGGAGHAMVYTAVFYDGAWVAYPKFWG